MIAVLATVAFTSINVTPCYADGGNGDQVIIFIGEGTLPGPIVRVSFAEQLPLQVEFDPASSMLLIRFRENLGTSLLELESLTSGTQYNEYYQGAPGVVPIMIPGQPDSYRPTITLSGGRVFSGMFDIY